MAAAKRTATEKGNEVEVEIAVIATKLSNIETSLAKIEKKLEEDRQSYVTQAQFAPVRIIVYSMVGLILSSFIGGLIMLIWQTQA